MVKMTARLNAGAPTRVREIVRPRMSVLANGERRARFQAARIANDVTRRSFHSFRAGHTVPARKGREENSPGEMVSHLQWKPSSVQSIVAFDVAEANSRVPYWIIQELGTGTSATLKRAGQSNPHGRPQTGSNYVVSIPAQTGRFISSALGWADSVGGTLTVPGAAEGQQLYLLSHLIGPRGGRVRRDRRRRLYIGREIHGQHMVRHGGQEGFREYRESVLAAARRAFEQN